MAELEPRRSTSPRAVRERRAYQLAVAGGGFALAGVVGLALAVFGVIGAGLPLLALVIAAICGVLFRRTVSG